MHQNLSGHVSLYTFTQVRYAGRYDRTSHKARRVD